MENETKTRKWYQKKRYVIPLGLLAIVFAIGIFSSPSENTSKVLPTSEDASLKGSLKIVPQDETVVLPSPGTPAQSLVKPELQPTPAPQPAPVPQYAPTPTPVQQESPTYYINSQGNTVQSPTKADSRPAGASAQCRDGSYSFSQSRRGTCSHHGGVAEWY